MSQSAVPSVAQSLVPGSRVAARTAATRRSGHSETNHDDGRASECHQRHREPAKGDERDHAVDTGCVDVRPCEHAVERDGEDRRGGERKPDHAADGLDGAEERHGEDGELVDA